MRSNRKKRAERFGRFAEWGCIALLYAKGYRLRARRWRHRLGEIDLVAQRGGNIVFVEVKARGSTYEAAHALGMEQRLRIQRAATAYLQRHAQDTRLTPRFDYMLVAPWRMPTHIADAWRPEFL